MDQQKEHAMAYEGLDPEQYRRELVEMGASDEDANAAVENLQRVQEVR